MHLLKENLGDNISIDIASDGQVALEILSASAFDLMITDLVMPNIEGLELIPKIKKQCPALPIIAVSGSNPYYLVMAKKLGIQDAFTKPINAHKFISSVKDILKAQPQMQNA